VFWCAPESGMGRSVIVWLPQDGKNMAKSSRMAQVTGINPFPFSFIVSPCDENEWRLRPEENPYQDAH
jgi:hypothetical protein